MAPVPALMILIRATRGVEVHAAVASVLQVPVRFTHLRFLAWLRVVHCESHRDNHHYRDVQRDFRVYDSDSELTSG